MSEIGTLAMRPIHARAQMVRQYFVGLMNPQIGGLWQRCHVLRCGAVGSHSLAVYLFIYYI